MIVFCYINYLAHGRNSFNFRSTYLSQFDTIFNGFSVPLVAHNTPLLNKVQNFQTHINATNYGSILEIKSKLYNNCIHHPSQFGSYFLNYYGNMLMCGFSVLQRLLSFVHDKCTSLPPIRYVCSMLQF